MTIEKIIKKNHTHYGIGRKCKHNFKTIARAICEEIEKMMDKNPKFFSHLHIAKETWQKFKEENGVKNE